MLKRLNTRIQKTGEIQESTKDTESLFTEVIAENPPNLEGKWAFQTLNKAFKPQTQLNKNLSLIHYNQDVRDTKQG